MHKTFKQAAISIGNAEKKKGERTVMRIKGIIAFRGVVLLISVALLITPIMPTSANPGSHTRNALCIEGSERILSICTFPLDAEVTNKTIPYARKQGYDLVFSEPDVGGNVTITVPKESYHSEPFFLKSSMTGMGPIYLWCQVYLVDDGIGTLATQPDSIDVDISTTVTGDGSGNYTLDVTIGDDDPDPAGSMLIYMPLNMNVWLGTSEVDPTETEFLFAMPFPMNLTTGFTEARIIDAAPYPPTSISMDGYYVNATGVPLNDANGMVTLVSSGASLDIYAMLLGIIPTYNDDIFTDAEVIFAPPPPVGGVWIPVDKLALLAPYIGFASIITLAIVAIAVFKYRKKQ